MEEAIRRLAPDRPLAAYAERELAAEGKVVIDRACEAARKLGDTCIGTHHLLLGILAEGKGPAALALAELDVDENKMFEACRDFPCGEIPEKDQKKPWYQFWR